MLPSHCRLALVIGRVSSKTARADLGLSLSARDTGGRHASSLGRVGRGFGALATGLLPVLLRLSRRLWWVGQLLELGVLLGRGSGIVDTRRGGHHVLGRDIHCHEIVIKYMVKLLML